MVDPDAGAIIFDGREMTHTPPNEVAGRGVVQVPGGKGAFPTLTVRENLRVAGWLNRHRRDDLEAATDRVLELFPVLGDRLDDAAADLSGGQQQMLSLGMALITRPRLLMIDELSIGLAPVVVEQLLPVVEELRDRGTTVLLVEQSVNLALTIAEKAFFMEKGEIRFQGQTSELLDRPDVLRSVFLEGAGAGMAVAAGDGDGRRSPAAESTADHDDSAAERPTIEARGPAMEGIGLVRHFGFGGSGASIVVFFFDEIIPAAAVATMSAQSSGGGGGGGSGGVVVLGGGNAAAARNAMVIGGAYAFKSGLDMSAEAEIHVDALSELSTSFEAEAEGIDPDTYVSELLRRVAVP